MQDELDYKYNYYCSVPHQEWYDLLSTTEAKENIKRAATHIKILAASKAAPAHSDSDASTKVPRKNKARTIFLPARKQKGN